MRAEYVFVVETPWNVTFIVTRTSLPFAFFGSFIEQLAAPAKTRPVARRGAVPTRTVHVTVPLASGRFVSPRVTPRRTANALPAAGPAGTTVTLPGRSVSGF